MSKTLVMTFLNQGGAKTSIRVNNVKDNVTDAEVKTAMNLIVSKNIFDSKGGNLVAISAAEVQDKTSSELVVK